MLLNNQTMLDAKVEKNGEVFLMGIEVQNEMPHYAPFLKGKKVYIPNTKKTVELAQADALARYFASSSTLNKFGLDELSYSFYDEMDNFVLITVKGNTVIRKEIDASFDDSRLFHVFKQIDKVDVVIANPEGHNADELFRYIYLSKKDYILSVNKMFIVHKIGFTALINGDMKFGYNLPKKYFNVKKDKVETRGDMMWITSFDNGFSPKFLSTFYDMQSYDYDKFDNINAINVDCVKMIPMNCDIVMGVPVTIIPELNLEQFEILGITSSSRKFLGGLGYDGFGTTKAIVQGRELNARLLIRFRNI